MTYNESLLADPLKFASRFSLKGDDDARRPAEVQGKVSGYTYSKMTRLSKISYLNCTRAKQAMELLPGDASLAMRNQAQNEGADTIVVTTHGPAEGLVPAWFLPWNAQGGTVSLSIPSKSKFDLGFWGANRTYGGGFGTSGKHVETYPNFFLTAAINGCSVFVNGTSQEPKIYHGGSGGHIEGDAIEVWRDMVTKITGSAPDAEVNKSHYVKDGSKSPQGQATTNTTNRFEKALNGVHEKTAIEIKEVRPWGAVFGVCSDLGEWAFYLQENATIKYEVVEKKKSLFNNKKIRTTFSVSRPMIVRQIFPGGGGSASLRSTFRWRAL